MGAPGTNRLDVRTRYMTIVLVGNMQGLTQSLFAFNCAHGGEYISVPLS
jgi:hypothetical protein